MAKRASSCRAAPFPAVMRVVMRRRLGAFFFTRQESGFVLLPCRPRRLSPSFPVLNVFS